MAGRKPKINVVQEVYHETKEHKEAREMATPICETQEFVPPSSLTDKELIIWNELVKIIKSVQGSYISDADIMTMEVYCKAKAEYDKACKEWSKSPKMYIQVDIGGFDRDGQPKTALKINPAYTIKKDFSNIMLKYLDQLGISPLGRAKQGIRATRSKIERDKDELMEIFNRSDD